ncbi:MerR family transcriptional regulator [Lactiplantibacillus plantarum]|uniref:MerR family transcriptional regulator n=1 Tax=Lactiplantibacillus plantarum TaxID=1590 RepID=UPI001BCDA7E1|nr:MerR family transcriptional regulator [Lactiplantibacillus plantarum]MBY7656784.1 MerR family transcriptional regulator [Lactiplantibacillus plantarum]
MFTITATAQKYGVSNNALRYYESVGLIGPIKRDQNGIRQFSASDQEMVNRIVHLRQLGASIKEIQQYIFRPEEVTLERTVALKKFLLRLNGDLEAQEAQIKIEKQYLKAKIEHLDGDILSMKSHKTTQMG